MIKTISAWFVATGVLAWLSIARAQDALQDSLAADSLGTSATLGDGTFFGLLFGTGNRGFTLVLMGILLVGVFLIAMKWYALNNDRNRGRKLYGLNVREAEAETVAQAVETETHHLLSEIFATMLNVFQTQSSAETLHDEVMNFIKQKQDQFASFKLRIDFLSDTAGAIGLLGTVWGIILVFANDVDDKQVVMAGMGVALVSTMVGLLVSLALNLFVTEVNTYFDRLLDRVVEKADVLRFRLMELVNQEVVTPSPTLSTASAWGGTSTGGTDATTFGRRINPGTRLDADTGKSRSKQPSRAPAQITLASRIPEVPLGATLRGIKFRVTDDAGSPVGHREVVFDHGNGQAQKAVTSLDGTASFDWSVGTQTGLRKAAAKVAETNLKVDVEVTVTAPQPAAAEAIGNNQSGAAGDELPKPVGVIVKSKSGRPIPDHRVLFSVEMGGGKIGAEKKEQVAMKTNASGEAFVPWLLGKKPGFNVLIVQVDGLDEKQTFQAMGADW